MTRKPKHIAADEPDARTQRPLESPASKVKRPSRKGIPTGAKWQFTNEQRTQLLPELRNPRDKAMLLVGAYVGFRISELLPGGCLTCLRRMAASGISS
jgi:hypothetical protein